ncbi:hypothetical protein pb186bvf_004215 [Paramecium bursaria]
MNQVNIIICICKIQLNYHQLKFKKIMTTKGIPDALNTAVDQDDQGQLGVSNDSPPEIQQPEQAQQIQMIRWMQKTRLNLTYLPMIKVSQEQKEPSSNSSSQDDQNIALNSLNQVDDGGQTNQIE